jgi:hypothetical protein
MYTNVPNNKVLVGGTFTNINQKLNTKFYPYFLESLANICPSFFWGGGGERLWWADFMILPERQFLAPSLRSST